MRDFRPALVRLLLGAAAFAPVAPALVAPAFAQTCACPPMEDAIAGPVIQTDEPPPPLPVHDQPAIPAPGLVWTPGYWAWNTYDYYWVPGVWVPPPQPGLLWTPAYWIYVGGTYYFRQGHWGPHVGFYGGVNYGFGYNGRGYQGGRWEGARFVYNTTVNNFGAVRVADVYTQPVIAAPGAARVSYNGGPGGVLLRPTPEEERLTAEDRVKPTPLQATQARTASMAATQFRSVVHGAPAVAATQRPGEFNGPGAVPAKAAGSVDVAPATGQTAVQPPPGASSLAPGVAPRPEAATAPTPRRAEEKPQPPSAPRMGTAPEARHDRPAGKGAVCGKPGERPCR